MKKFIIAFLALGSIVYGVTQSTSTVWNVANSAGTADLIQLSSAGALKVEGTVTAAGLVNSGAASATALTVSASPGYITTAALGAAPTNTVAGSLTVKINGTNYLMQVYKN